MHTQSKVRGNAANHHHVATPVPKKRPLKLKKHKKILLAAPSVSISSLALAPASSTLPSPPSSQISSDISTSPGQTSHRTVSTVPSPHLPSPTPSKLHSTTFQLNSRAKRTIKRRAVCLSHHRFKHTLATKTRQDFAHVERNSTSKPSSHALRQSQYLPAFDIQLHPPPASFFNSTPTQSNPVQSFFSTLSSWASSTMTSIASQTGLVSHAMHSHAFKTATTTTTTTSKRTITASSTQHSHRKSILQRASRRTHSTTSTTSQETGVSAETHKPLGQLYVPGQVHHGFHVDTAEVYPSLSLAVYTFTHERSQAQFVHIERDDSDNAFCVGFRTMPHDDTGVAHILEHTVLCGSRKYPVRDPFFLLIRKSFATFMNAMTRPEATYYPFSTQNEQDFNNLLDVYLDAVFFPLLRLYDFRQEGHRIEPVGLFKEDQSEADGDNEDEGETGSEDGTEESTRPAIDDIASSATIKTTRVPTSKSRANSTKPQSSQSESESESENQQHLNTDHVAGDSNEAVPDKFEFKGVVFNEMKGDMSDPRSWLFGRITRHLHTTSIYRNNSGGDPIAIPNLTHQELLDFHATHYHPGNSIFMTYGNRTPVLEQANEVILAKLADLKAQYPDRCVGSNYGQDDFPPEITSISAVSMVKNSSRFTKPRCIVEPGPCASLEDKDRPYKVTMSWLCHDNCITDVLSDSLLDFSKFSIDQVESTIEFTSILDEGAKVDQSNPDHIVSPDRVIQDDAQIATIVEAAQAPKIRRSPLAKLTPEEWYNTQISDEIASGQRLFDSKVAEMQSTAQLSTREEALALLTAESPDLLTLIPQPKRPSAHLLTSTNQDVVNLLQRIKRLPRDQQESINLQFEQSALSILSSLLFDNTYSPLYTLLSDPSLGTSPSPATGCDTWEHTPSFSMGFNGVKHGQVDLVMDKLHKALVEIAETGEGINSSTLSAILHQWEISLKEHKKQFGVNMLQRLISPFAHNQDIQHGFQIVDLLPLFKHVVETSGSLYFRTLIKHHLLSNPHRLMYVMTPDHNLADKLQADEADVLARKTKDWSEGDKLQCKAEAVELKEHQDAAVDDSCLPSVKVSDINPKLIKYRYVTFPMGGQVHIPVPAPNSNSDIDLGDFVNHNAFTRKHQHINPSTALGSINLLSGDDKMTCRLDAKSPLTDISSSAPSHSPHDLDITDLLSPSSTSHSQALPATTPILSRPITFNVQPTNGIVTIRALINDVGARFTPYQLSMIPFLNLLFGRIGAAGKDYKSHSHLIDQTATDFSIQFASDDMRVETPDPTDPTAPPRVDIQTTFQASIKGKCLARNVEKMCQLLTESLTAQDYTEHVYNTLAQYAGGLQSAIEENSARYAMLDAQARLPNNSNGIMQNLVHGLPHVQATTTLFKSIAADLQEYQDMQAPNDDQHSDSSAVKRVSPRMMRLANDIAETMRCLILGPAESQFTHIAPATTTTTTTTNQSPSLTSSDDTLVAISNANYFGPKSFPGFGHTTTQKSNHHQQQPHPDHIDYSKHQHDPVYPNPHISVPDQFPLTFPFGFDRILVTCDENTLNHPQYKPAIVNGVSNLINGVYTAQPTAYKPENSLLAMGHDDDDDDDTPTPSSTPTIHTPQIKQSNRKTHVAPLLSARNKYANQTSNTISSLGQNDQSDPSIPSTAAQWLEQLNSATPQVTANSVAKYNFIAAPVQVNSVVYCEKTAVTHLHPDFGAMQVLAELVNERFLHIEVREKGGAYGRFASLDRNGVFTMGSIRDPQCTRTVEAFKRALTWLRNEDIPDSSPPPSAGDHETAPRVNTGNYTNQDLDEAKISIFGSIDAPESAANRGLSPWLRNANHSDRERLRANMLATSLDDIKRCAKLHLNFDHAVISVVGNKQKIPQEVQENVVWTVTVLDMEAPPEGTGDENNADDDSE